MIELLNTVNTLYATFKTVKELYEKADYIQLKEYILEMNKQLLDMKEIALELREENINLKNEVNKLTAASERNMVLQYRAYYDESGNGPYCPVCYDNKKKVVLLSNTLGHQNCSACGFILH
jgi:hypothetical protein